MRYLTVAVGVVHGVVHPLLKASDMKNKGECPTEKFENTMTGEGTFYDDQTILIEPGTGNCGFCQLDSSLNDLQRVALSYPDYGRYDGISDGGVGGAVACGMCIKFKTDESQANLPSEWKEWTYALVVDSCTGCKKGDIDFAQR